MTSVYSPTTMNLCAYLDRGGISCCGTRSYLRNKITLTYHMVMVLEMFMHFV
ncbi:hypothetical protein HanRHA438_Chr02g0047211 [Helianthus annuus]|nr:hypothetical protein HanRHA438_Chr02g0047211 [Helianthus annuus]